MNENEIRRLVLAKKLYLHGCSHASNKDEISKMLAIHNFDNVIELVLKCIATNFDIQNKKKNLDFKFKDLWNEINNDDEYKKDNVMLPLKDQMFGLHELRNTIQHQGDIPSSDSVIKYKGYSEDFFRVVAENIFKISYEELYLSSLIGNEELKGRILTAEKAFKDRDFRKCIEFCDDALSAAAFDIGDISSKAGLLTGYLGARDELDKVFRDNYAEGYKDTSYYKFAQEISKALLQLGLASTSMQFLDEFRLDFLRHREQVDKASDLAEEKLKESAQFSLDFATNVILRWQEVGILKGERGDD